MLEIKNVCMGYGKKQVLHGVSAAFEKGRLTSIIGPNGCGKSTLLKGAMGMLPLMSGSVTVDGCALESMTPKSSAQKIAYLAQGKSVPDMTVEQMVLHGRFAHLSYPRIYRQADREIALSAMKRMHIEHLAGESVAALSGGMRQNSYLAMALAQDADYILLDEPTTYLDIGHRLQLMQTLKDLAKNGKGIVAVLHDLTIAMEYSDTVTVMNDGVVIMSDTPERVFDCGVIGSVFDVALKRCPDGDGFAYYYTKL